MKKVDETLLAEGMASAGEEGDVKKAVGKGDLAKGDQDLGHRVGQGGKAQGTDKLALRAALEGEFRETQRKQQQLKSGGAGQPEALARPLMPSILNAWRQSSGNRAEMLLAPQAAAFASKGAARNAGALKSTRVEAMIGKIHSIQKPPSIVQTDAQAMLQQRFANKSTPRARLLSPGAQQPSVLSPTMINASQTNRSVAPSTQWPSHQPSRQAQHISQAPAHTS